MVASSLSTYLDATQSVDESAVPTTASLIPVNEAAKILVAIQQGTTLATDLPDATGLSIGEVLELLGLMSKAGMVELDEKDNVVHVTLTEGVKKALAA